jgi:hypothetical protein
LREKTETENPSTKKEVLERIPQPAWDIRKIFKAMAERFGITFR